MGDVIEPRDERSGPRREPAARGLEALLALPLTIERVATRALELRTRSGWRRRTTELRLSGVGCVGASEDVTFERADHAYWFGVLNDYRFEGTLGAFLDGLDKVLRARLPEPARPVSRRYRRWALEAAAIDLALARAGATLGEVLKRSERPLRYVVSASLGKACSLEPLRELAERWPGIEFKLDATAAWTPALVDELKSLGRVRIVDWKAAGGAGVGVGVASHAVLSAVVQGTDWIVEDPPAGGEAHGLLRGAPRRVSWDAPLGEAGALERAGAELGHVNLKPSRSGSLAGLLELAELGLERGCALYLGAQFELGPGRLQLHELGRLLCPEGPNDASPSAFHAPGPVEAAASPLEVPTRRPGFGRG